MMSALVNHLWQSTLFALAAWMLTLALRNNGARIRYWIWFAASVKFLLPFSLLVALGQQLGQIAQPSAVAAPEFFVDVVQQFTQPMTSASGFPTYSSGGLALAVSVLWALGCATLLLRWLILWMRVRAEVNAADTPDFDLADFEMPLAVRTSRAHSEPGVAGILEPVLLLPAGIERRLTASQLRAVLAHELCHVRCCDNLTASIHMLVQAVFWFHPAVWWIGARMMEEREHACDEEALESGGDREDYAAGILAVCRHGVESRLACAAGATGANLQSRITKIMSNGVARRLSFARKFLLTCTSALAVATPIVAGAAVAREPVVGPLHLTFDTLSIHLRQSEQPGRAWLIATGGTLSMRNMSLRGLIAFAYGVDASRVNGGPSWLDSVRYDFDAAALERERAAGADDPAAYRPMVRELLAARFNIGIIVNNRCEEPCGRAHMASLH
ncbi:MAG TPA: M56 family metallopeptidase [Povalibacter sp.]|nr:M56 family metallopeptidase [Povalibacter sp.]